MRPKNPPTPVGTIVYLGPTTKGVIIRSVAYQKYLVAVLLPDNSLGRMTVKEIPALELEGLPIWQPKPQDS